MGRGLRGTIRTEISQVVPKAMDIFPGNNIHDLITAQNMAANSRQSVSRLCSG
jgi:hypothetical protein